MDSNIEQRLAEVPLEKLIELRERFRRKGMSTKMLTLIIGKRTREIEKKEDIA